MSATAIAKRYAKALVGLGDDEGAVDRFQAALNSVEEVFQAYPELGSMLANPAYGADAKRNILKDVMVRLSVPTTVANFLLLLLERNRLAALEQIVLEYGILADERSGLVRAKVTTAMPLEESQVAGIRSALSKMGGGKKVEVTVTVDQSIIGGVVTQVGDMVFDGSVKTQLARIEDTLQKG